jgi:hypothetical protein
MVNLETGESVSWRNHPTFEGLETPPIDLVGYSEVVKAEDGTQQAVELQRQRVYKNDVRAYTAEKAVWEFGWNICTIDRNGTGKAVKFVPIRFVWGVVFPGVDLHMVRPQARGFRLGEMSESDGAQRIQARISRSQEIVAAYNARNPQASESVVAEVEAEAEAPVIDEPDNDESDLPF